MNFILHKHDVENQIAKIPNGLLELIADITREILRDQPENIYEYIANYLDAMLITREHARISQRTMTSIYDLSINISDLMLVTGISLPMAEKSANLIENTFRENVKNHKNDFDLELKKDWQIIEMDIFKKLVEKCKFTKEQLRKSQKIIQNAFKNYYFHEYDFKLQQELPKNEWINKVKNTLNIYRQSEPEPWQLDRAARIIQSTYRGYYTRKSLNSLKNNEYNENNDNFENYDNHAIKIQSAYRGYRDRKSLKAEQNAATQIQARYRGYQCRKSINNKQMIKRNEHCPPSIDCLSELSTSIVINQADKFDDLYNETTPIQHDNPPENVDNDNNNTSSSIQVTNDNNNVSSPKGDANDNNNASSPTEDTNDNNNLIES